MPEIQTPEWVKDAIFYQIFPDRFAKSDAVPKASGLQPWGAPPTLHGYQGGDLLGVAEHLDYLADLGINAIYFNPIFRSGSNHRYHTLCTKGQSVQRRRLAVLASEFHPGDSQDNTDVVPSSVVLTHIS